MPFGIMPAPEEYQKRQKQALEGLHGIQVIADDILVAGYGNTVEEATADHDKNLESLLQRCREVEFEIKPEES